MKAVKTQEGKEPSIIDTYHRYSCFRGIIAVTTAYYRHNGREGSVELESRRMIVSSLAQLAAVVTL
jgi:hypothetical protein